MSGSEKIRVAILFGGQSAEHEISLLSARNVLAALDRSRFEPLLIGIDKAGRWLEQEPERLLASARDPRLVHIDADGPTRALAPLAQPSAAADKPIDVIFPVLHG